MGDRCHHSASVPNRLTSWMPVTDGLPWHSSPVCMCLTDTFVYRIRSMEMAYRWCILTHLASVRLIDLYEDVQHEASLNRKNLLYKNKKHCCRIVLSALRMGKPLWSPDPGVISQVCYAILLAHPLPSTSLLASHTTQRLIRCTE